MAPRLQRERAPAAHQEEEDGRRPNDERGQAHPGQEDQLPVPPLQPIRQTQID